MPRRLATLAVSAVLALSASAETSTQAPKPMKAPTPSQAVSNYVQYRAPKGWQVEEYANGGGADPVVAFVDGLDRITVRVFGAPGSGYKTPASFLKGPAATTMGRKPEAAGTVETAGRRLPLYKREFPVNLGDPHSPSGPSIMGKEVFVLLPSGDRFVVLSYARESPAPDLERVAEKAWAAFLKTVKPAGRKA